VRYSSSTHGMHPRNLRLTHLVNRRCYCADHLDLGTQAIKPDGGSCDRPCPGAPGLLCGGTGAAPASYLLTVYGAVLQHELPLPPPMAAPSVPMPPVVPDDYAQACEGDCAHEYAVITITSCSESGVHAVTPAPTHSLIAASPLPLTTALAHPANSTRPPPPMVTASSAGVSKPSADVRRALIVGFVVSVAMVLI
jgi:hypothetical protein